MTIEELFGTLQQSTVATWRKHLRTAKYGKHEALDEFYKEMPEKVDALIEAWMGAHGKKVKGYDNLLSASNMNTLKYLGELKKVCKDGYELMGDNDELKGLLDDIVNQINSTLYKVKELSESTMVSLSDFINEALICEAKDLPEYKINGVPTFVLQQDDFEVIVLSGDYTMKDALKAKRLISTNKDLGKYEEDIQVMDADEWEELNESLNKEGFNKNDIELPVNEAMVRKMTVGEFVELATGNEFTADKTPDSDDLADNLANDDYTFWELDGESTYDEEEVATELANLLISNYNDNIRVTVMKASHGKRSYQIELDGHVISAEFEAA